MFIDAYHKHLSFGYLYTSDIVNVKKLLMYVEFY